MASFPQPFLLLFFLSAVNASSVRPKALVASGHHSLQRLALPPSDQSWPKNRPLTLTYAFSDTHFHPSLPRADVEAAFAFAFDRWAAVVPITFLKVNIYEVADIGIGFYGGDHGDEAPFDGPSGVLAHTTGPGEGSFVHFDVEEPWTVLKGKDAAAVDVESVAMHEIGHVLGLNHSRDEEAVMYPTYNVEEVKVKLTEGDIKEAQKIYGVNPNYCAVSSSAAGGGWRLLRSCVVAVVMAALVLVRWCRFCQFMEDA